MLSLRFIFSVPYWNEEEICLPCRLLLSPDRNFFILSTASPPWFSVVFRLSLLFLRLVRVSTMNRVRELSETYIEDRLVKRW